MCLEHRQGFVLDHRGRPVDLHAGDAFLQRGSGGVSLAATDDLVVTSLEVEVRMAILGEFRLVFAGQLYALSESATGADTGIISGACGGEVGQVGLYSEARNLSIAKE